MSLSYSAFRLLQRTSTRSCTPQEPGTTSTLKVHQTLRLLRRVHPHPPNQRSILSIEPIFPLLGVSTAPQCRHSHYVVGLNDGKHMQPFFAFAIIALQKPDLRNEACSLFQMFLALQQTDANLHSRRPIVTEPRTAYTAIDDFFTFGSYPRGNWPVACAVDI